MAFISKKKKGKVDEKRSSKMYSSRQNKLLLTIHISIMCLILYFSL